MSTRFLDQLEELGPVPVDAERIGERERHLPPRLGGDVGGLPEGSLGLGPVEQVALEIKDARRADQLGIDLAAAELRAHAEDVFMVRWPSGVTRISERPVGSHPRSPAAC